MKKPNPYLLSWQPNIGQNTPGTRISSPSIEELAARNDVVEDHIDVGKVFSHLCSPGDSSPWASTEPQPNPDGQAACRSAASMSAS